MEDGAFNDIKLLNFGWIIAGPWVVKYLADHGAEVIHVETRTHPDLLRTAPPYKENLPGPDRTAYFVNYHCNSYGMTLNLNHPRAKSVARRLIEWADVVLDNFTPGTMEKWGFTYEKMKEIKEDIIWISLSQLGQTGPYSSMPGTGIQLTGLSGIAHLTGWEDRAPSVLYGGYTDCGAARIAACALIAALDYRKRTKKGQRIDLSQYEAGGVHFIAPLILDYIINGRIAGRMGNRLTHACPHGVYPCKGEERWCAISVSNDTQWKGLCMAMDNPDWANEERFSTFLLRKKNEEELDHRIATWTSSLTREEVIERLQARGVPAGKVNDMKDLYEDPQLLYRRFFWEVDHSVLGRKRFESQAFSLSLTPCKLRMPAPLMGEHNEYICTEILGMRDEEFVDLLNDGVFE